MERSLLLIDTQANGTAIMYTGQDSGLFNDTNDSIKVELLDGIIEGRDVTDQICLDENEDVCIDDFYFINVAKAHLEELGVVERAQDHF